MTNSSYYVRVDIDDPATNGANNEPNPVDVPGYRNGLTFVDLHTSLRTQNAGTDAQNEALTNAIQDRLQLIAQTDRILFRWPWIIGPEEEPHSAQINNWIKRLTDRNGGEPVLPHRTEVGVIQHRIAGEPVLSWAPEPPTDGGGHLRHARSIELAYLLRRYNAIWEPTSYHYRLPSGEHTDAFVRVADAIHEPQDAYVMVCWLSRKLRPESGIVVDTGGLTPLLIQIESLLARVGLKIGPTSILPAYPTGRTSVRQTVENARTDTSPNIVAVLSVSSTGTLERTLTDELERVAESDGVDYSLDVMVDLTHVKEPVEPRTNISNKADSWFKQKRDSASRSSSSCEMCRSSDKSPVVAIDPRTYGAMTLPSPHLVMPDIHNAMAGQLFWERARATRGIAIEANPHPSSKSARGKRVALSVRPIFELIARPEGLSDMVKQRWETLSEDWGGQDKTSSDQEPLNRVFQRTALIVASSHDLATAKTPEFAGKGDIDFEASVRLVIEGIGLDKDLPIVAPDGDELAQRLADLESGDAILIFAWGSVTGLTLRHLKLAVADALRAKAKELSVNGLVFHARPSTLGEWESQQNQFRPGSLACLWSSYFPWHSPLRDEGQLIDRPEIDDPCLSESASHFLRERQQFLSTHSTFMDRDDDWSPRFDRGDNAPHPEHIFWGMSRHNVHQAKVRGRSLYGRDLGCVSAYAAMGSVINYTRLNERPAAAPRWVLFDMSRIVRSYFDAIITCSIIRWLQPGELWWGTDRDDGDAVIDSVTFLLSQATSLKEQVLLVPELLLAAAQGKVPTLAHATIQRLAREISSSWPNELGFNIARGSVELGLWLIDNG